MSIVDTSQQAQSDMDLSDLGLMALYSEVHPTVTYIVHYGINMLAPVYKLQVRSGRMPGKWREGL